MKNVLLVDDDSIFNFLSSKLLQRTGMVNDIHTALNGQQALDLFNDYYQGARSLPDVILLDLNMPIMDGFAFLEAFQKLNFPGKEKVRVVIVTSSQDPSDVEKARNLGISQYLTKPLYENDLVRALQSA